MFQFNAKMKKKLRKSRSRRPPALRCNRLRPPVAAGRRHRRRRRRRRTAHGRPKVNGATGITTARLRTKGRGFPVRLAARGRRCSRCRRRRRGRRPRAEFPAVGPLPRGRAATPDHGRPPRLSLVPSGRRVLAPGAGGGGAAPDALAAAVPVAVEAVRAVLAAVAVGRAIAVSASSAHGVVLKVPLLFFHIALESFPVVASRLRPGKATPANRRAGIIRIRRVNTSKGRPT